MRLTSTSQSSAVHGVTLTDRALLAAGINPISTYPGSARSLTQPTNKRTKSPSAHPSPAATSGSISIVSLAPFPFCAFPYISRDDAEASPDHPTNACAVTRGAKVPDFTWIPGLTCFRFTTRDCGRYARTDGVSTAQRGTVGERGTYGLLLDERGVDG